jgi:four helix bundle protein
MSNQNFDFRERCYKFSEGCVLFLERMYKNGFYRPLIYQAVKSTTSVGANVTESKHSKTKKEFARFYEIALKSGNESAYWLRLFINTLCRGNPAEVKQFLDEQQQINRILAASLKTMRKNDEKD